MLAAMDNGSAMMSISPLNNYVRCGSTERQRDQTGEESGESIDLMCTAPPPYKNRADGLLTRKADVLLAYEAEDCFII
jgi:hypothetical protein